MDSICFSILLNHSFLIESLVCFEDLICQKCILIEFLMFFNKTNRKLSITTWNRSCFFKNPIFFIEI
jgi:hypothetical protein